MNGLQQVIYDASRILLWPVLIAILACLVWVLIELGYFLYELYLRFRYRDLDALEARALKARRAFEDGKPRTAYRYLQENNYSMVVARFLFDLIRNYQTQRLAAKPLKLLQEYEFYTVKRLERTRVLVRLGPILGLMGTLIPLSPALVGLANGDTSQFTDSLVTAFSVTVLGLLIGGIAYVISVVRDRMYAQDISDMEYLLELLEGGSARLRAGRRRDKKGAWDADLPVDYELDAGDLEQTPVVPVLDEVPLEPLVPVASGNGGRSGVVTSPFADDGSGAPEAAPRPMWDAGGADAAVPADAAVTAALTLDATPGPGAATSAQTPAPPAGETPSLSFDDPEMSWQRDDDPFAALGPRDAEPPAGTSGSAGRR